MNDKLRLALNDYNWDDGFDFPKELLAHPDCDLALALEIFYLADGYSYLLGNYGNTCQKEWQEFVETLYNDIPSGKYVRTASTFEIPLTKVQKHKLKTQQIPEVFLADLL